MFEKKPKLGLEYEGYNSIPPPPEELISRRQALRAALGGMGVVLAPMLQRDSLVFDDTSDEAISEASPIQTAEAQEKSIESPQFRALLEGYKAGNELGKDEVLFTDSTGAPIAKVKLVAIDGVSPGDFEPIGDEGDVILNSKGLKGAWLKAVRARLCAEYQNLPPGSCDPSRALPRVHSRISNLRFARRYDSTSYEDLETLPPEEKRWIEPGFDIDAMNNQLDVITFFGTKETIGGSGMNRFEFVTTIKDKISDRVPDIVQEEIASVIPGLCAQESTFNNNMRSRVGAAGIFQFMPGTWRELGFTEPDLLRLTKQVEGAAQYFSRAYRNIVENKNKGWSEAAVEKIRTTYFTSDEAFQRDFLTPVLINSYNAGPKRMASVINWFVENHGTSEQVQEFGVDPTSVGHDLFALMISLAKSAGESDAQYLGAYSTDAYEYTPRIYALAEQIRDLKNRG